MSEQTKVVPIDWPECREFYDLMQAYRHAPETDQTWVIVRYQNVQNFLRRKVNTMLAAAPQPAQAEGKTLYHITFDVFTLRLKEASEQKFKLENELATANKRLQMAEAQNERLLDELEDAKVDIERLLQAALDNKLLAEREERK